ncbi:hypothetical protein [Subtercola vilae]|uniref:hypothetical protein n=1 Tax=Subtercola vilae TaxID=2056433 RepID=UPI0013C33230|nr:hypothetical protein [Subtercola vilae]
MDVTLTIRSGEDVRQLQATGSGYESVRDQVTAQVPEGWQMLSYRVDRAELVRD